MSASTLGPARLRLGTSGLKVSKIILGCMSYGPTEWRPWVLEEEDAIKHIKFAYDAGIQTFDTANIYSNGMGEVVLGNAIKKLQLPREEIVVMTKVRGAVGKTTGVNSMELFLAGPDNVGYVNQHGLSGKHIMDSVQASLKRLQLDYIDVLQCHRFDYDTPIAETMQALHDVVQAGHVRYIGMSSCHAWQCETSSLLYREEEREMMPTLKHFGMGSIPWSPLARGALTRPYTDSDKTLRQSSDEVPPDAYFLLGSGNKAVVARVEEIAKKHQATMAQVALAWLMAKDGVTAPVVGTTSLEKLKDLLGALDITLSAEDIKYSEEPYKPMGIMLYG
ncbi:Aldo/keto reductase [Mycena sp. CBHHK59/15]|nr:Aldo/keto reductase [Mycena sp. CBHHK59/15]